MLKVQNQLLSQYLIEIFGNKDVKENLLAKSIPQKTKFNLKLLGNILVEKEKEFFTKLTALRETYAPNGEPEESTKEEFEKLGRTLFEEEIEVKCYNFTEDDFIDSKTNKVVGSEGIYFNLIDKLVYEKENPEN